MAAVVFSPLAEPFVAKAGALCAPFVAPGRAVRCDAAADKVDPFERAPVFPFECRAKPPSDAMVASPRLLRLERRGPGELVDRAEEAAAGPAPAPAPSTGSLSLSASCKSVAACSCDGEDPEDRLRRPRTWDTEPDDGAGLRAEDSIFADEAGAPGAGCWRDRSTGVGGWGAEISVLEEIGWVCEVDGSSEVAIG